MSDKENKKSQSETTLQELDDDQLESAQGGLKIAMDDILITSYSTGGSAAEINQNDKRSSTMPNTASRPPMSCEVLMSVCNWLASSVRV